jgi:23S rRNA pseudouridine1911/1915/1917 synthase
MYRPGIVHRIDKDTTGLLVVAKNERAHRGLARQLKDHSITRKYIALVKGVVAEDKGIVDAPIGRHPVHRKKMAVVAKNSKRAVTHFSVLKRYAGYTLVELELETGRTHQIRVHMAYIGHPVVGDPVYGQGGELGANGQLLHAAELGFIHPLKGQYMKFEADLPEGFKDILDSLQ